MVRSCDLYVVLQVQDTHISLNTLSYIKLELSKFTNKFTNEYINVFSYLSTSLNVLLHMFELSPPFPTYRLLNSLSSAVWSLIVLQGLMINQFKEQELQLSQS